MVYVKKIFFLLIISIFILSGCKTEHNFKYVSTFKNNFARVEIGGKCYLIDKMGRILNKEGFEDISNMSHNKAYFKKNKKYGFIDNNGNIVIEPKYDFLTKVNDNVYILRANNKYGHYILDKEILVEPKYDRLYQFKQGYAFVKEEGFGKYIDYNGNVLIDKLSFGLNFDKNFAVTSRQFDPSVDDLKKLGIKRKNIKKGEFLVDKNGKTYLDDYDPTKEEQDNENPLYFINYNKGKYYFHRDDDLNNGKNSAFYSFDENIKVLKLLNIKNEYIHDVDIEWFVNEDIMIVSKNKKSAVIDNKGVNKFGFIDGLVVYISDLDLYNVKQKNKEYILNTDFENMIDIDYDEIYFNSSKYIRLKKDGKIGMVDTLGNLITKPIYDEIGPMFVEGHIRVKIGDKWGFMSEDGVLDIECKFDKVYCFKEGLAPVCKDEKWGFIDKNGKLVIDYEYDRVQKFSEGLSAVYKDDEAYYINKKGEIVLK